MKNIALIAISSIISLSAHAQRLKLDIANTTADQYNYFHYTELSFANPINKYHIEADQRRTANIVFDFKKPTRVTLVVSPDKGYRGNTFIYHFFLTPGDDVSFSADFKKANYGIKVTGKGSQNNQPLMALDKEAPIRPFYGDSIPDRVIAFVNKQQAARRAALAQYIKTYKPSPAFIKDQKYDAAYYGLNRYFAFKENNKFRNEQRYQRNIAKWQQVQDSLMTDVRLTLAQASANGVGNTAAADRSNLFLNQLPDQNFLVLNNAAALGTNNYDGFIKDFVLRYKEALWRQANDDPQKFFTQWYGADTDEARKQYHDDAQNLLKERIVNKFFTGAMAEYLLAEVLKGSKDEANPKNAVAIYERFKARYPKSKYVALYKPYIDEVLVKEKLQLTDKMVFMANNGNKLNTLNEILALNKGKTLLVDMWGTWCGPCREEITKHGAAIKAHFKGKGLDYLYVANRDEGNEPTWKKLIAYFNLEGTHILANPKLDKDIMASIKGSGYPTYFIIKKDGTYELSKAGYPMDRDVLIKQLEAALAME